MARASLRRPLGRCRRSQHRFSVPVRNPLFSTQKAKITPSYSLLPLPDFPFSAMEVERPRGGDAARCKGRTQERRPKRHLVFVDKG